MKTKKTIEKCPGGLMIIPLMLGALVNTIDKAHLSFVQKGLKSLGARPVVKLSCPAESPAWTVTSERERSIRAALQNRDIPDKEITGTIESLYAMQATVNAQTNVALQQSFADMRIGLVTKYRELAVPLGVTRTEQYEFLKIGGFTTALVLGPGALCLIGLFLVCAGAQMNLRVGGRALKKGLIITSSKFLVALVMGVLFGLFCDPFAGFLGLSVLAVVAAMENSNGGLYVALTSEYGNHSDVGAIAVLSLNDGPLFTLIILWFLGAAGILQGTFPFIAFLAVLLPILLGMLLGNLDEDIRTFLKPGEKMLIPFFAFALGTLMNFSVFLNMDVLAGGLALGLATTLLTGGFGALMLKVFREKSVIAGVAEGSTAGNATATPAAVAVAATAAFYAGKMPAEMYEQYLAVVKTATAQVSISTLSTCIFCPIAVMLWDRRQKRRGIDGRLDEEEQTT